MKGILFNIKRYAIHDGPGIRVTYFMKGCPLACRWCHNPEGISPAIETVQRIDKIGDREFKLTEQVGKEYSVSELLSLAGRERVFIDESGGGVTFSGGEPLSQPEFLVEALGAFRDEGIHTAVDTSGFASWKSIESIIPLTDLFLYDLKHIDNEEHKRLTGVGNELIINNLQKIAGKGKIVHVRVPLIPGINDGREHIARLVDFISSLNADSIKEIDLLPYHKIGSSKYKRFNMEYMMEGVEQPSQETMNRVSESLKSTGIKVKTGG